MSEPVPTSPPPTTGVKRDAPEDPPVDLPPLVVEACAVEPLDDSTAADPVNLFEDEDPPQFCTGALFCNHPDIRDKLARFGMRIPNTPLRFGAFAVSIKASTNFDDIDALLVDLAGAVAGILYVSEKGKHDECEYFYYTNESEPSAALVDVAGYEKRICSELNQAVFYSFYPEATEETRDDLFAAWIKSSPKCTGATIIYGGRKAPPNAQAIVNGVAVSGCEEDLFCFDKRFGAKIDRTLPSFMPKVVRFTDVEFGALYDMLDRKKTGVMLLLTEHTPDGVEMLHLYYNCHWVYDTSLDGNPDNLLSEARSWLSFISAYLRLDAFYKYANSAWTWNTHAHRYRPIGSWHPLIKAPEKGPAVRAPAFHLNLTDSEEMAVCAGGADGAGAGAGGEPKTEDAEKRSPKRRALTVPHASL